MAKKDLLKTQMTRPTIKRTRVADEDKMDEAVKQVTKGQSPAPAAEAAAKKPDGAEKQLGGKATPRQTPKPTGTGKPAAEKVARPRKEAGKQDQTTPASTSKQTRGETTKSAPSLQDSEEKEPVKRMTIDLPQSLHKRLKMLSIREEIYMKDYIIALIQKSLGKND